MSGVRPMSRGATGGLVRGRPVERLGAGAYVCRLGSGTAVFNLQGDVCSLAAELGEPGVPVLIAGLPSIDRAALERLVASQAERCSPLVVTGLLAAQTAGRAVVEAAAERRVGAPVFLRYAAEWPTATE